jgi:hypothetical protein
LSDSSSTALKDGAIQIIGRLAALDALDDVVSQSRLTAHADVVTPLVFAVVPVRHPEHRELAQARRQSRREQQMHKRYRDAVDIITDIIKRGQSDGTFRPDFDAVTKAVEILAFINGMETLWLLDPSIPLTEVFKVR